MKIMPISMPKDIDKYFFNRTKDIKMINTQLSTLKFDIPPQMLITGYRGVGKTFLLRKILKDQGNNILTVFLDISEIMGRQKGKLTEDEVEILKKSDSVWGCDICSLVCPHNSYLPISDYYLKFKDRIISDLNMDDLEGLSNNEFKRKFNDRAFVWRGISVLRRNLEILECTE